MHDIREPAPSTPIGLRERKKAARREALVAASHDLVCELGLDAVTVEMICDRVGVSQRTFFNYFDSKVDAVLGITPWSIDSGAAECFADAGPTGNLLLDCAALASGELTDFPMDLDRMGQIMRLVQHEPRLLVRQMAWFEEQCGVFERLAARRNGVGEAGPAEKSTAMVVMLIVRSALTHWDSAGRTEPPVTYLPVVVAELRGLLATD
ncbi:transcriptional regulator, TetR family [Sanguibacter gelidistatuariae]|uniref:Transcriptional regulator, TetR family n=1 Tax=Sanguibacter gelidistatuariae TaxID=1814289 RepID=A0A1G6NIA4_9MICO|nr:TetR/AcrR family transcriptional regulator [Sanguibacter gelidistatuariae]SDC67037.1 transcriptional regulator, TetR family [Sanguibacter gelidistatuariae]